MLSYIDLELPLPLCEGIGGVAPSVREMDCGSGSHRDHSGSGGVRSSNSMALKADDVQDILLAAWICQQFDFDKKRQVMSYCIAYHTSTFYTYLYSKYRKYLNSFDIYF